MVGWADQNRGPTEPEGGDRGGEDPGAAAGDSARDGGAVEKVHSAFVGTVPRRGRQFVFAVARVDHDQCGVVLRRDDADAAGEGEPLFQQSNSHEPHVGGHSVPDRLGGRD